MPEKKQKLSTLDHIPFENLCSASVDGTLTRAEKKELEAHLKICPACQDYLEDMRAMRALWRELDHPIPSGLHGSIMAAVQAEQIVQMPAAEPADAAPETESVPVEAPVISLHVKKRTQSVVLMLAAAAACVTLVVTGGFAGIAGGGAGMDAAADAAVAAEAPAAAAPREMLLDTAASDTETMESKSNGTAAYATGADAAPAETAAEEGPAASTVREPQAMPAHALPEIVSERQFAMAYLAIGKGDLPGIGEDGFPVIEEAVLLIEEDGRSYYSLPNDISVLETVFDVLADAGYTITVTESVTGEGSEGAQPGDLAAEVLLTVNTIR